MLLVVIIVLSFTTLNVTIDENYLRIKFGYGIFRKKFPLDEIISAKNGEESLVLRMGNKIMVMA